MLKPLPADLTAFEARADQAARLLRALSNERRLMVLCQLADSERSVGQLTPASGLSQSALSQHLAVLRREGVVATRREAQTVRYRIRDAAALRLVATLVEIFCPAGAPAAPGCQVGLTPAHGALDEPPEAAGDAA